MRDFRLESEWSSMYKIKFWCIPINSYFLAIFGKKYARLFICYAELTLYVYIDLLELVLRIYETDLYHALHFNATCVDYCNAQCNPSFNVRYSITHLSTNKIWRRFILSDHLLSEDIISEKRFTGLVDSSMGKFLFSPLNSYNNTSSIELFIEQQQYYFKYWIIWYNSFFHTGACT